MNHVYVDFDSLMDTRMGVISYMDEAMAVKLASDANYFKRQNNDFRLLIPEFDQERYAKLWSKRHLGMVAGRSYMTKVVELISSYSRSKLTTATVVDQNPNVTVTVNLHPYKLTKEQKRFLKYQLKNSLFSKNVKLVNWPQCALTPTRIREEFDKVIMFDFDGWQCMHYAELMTRPFPEVEVIHPFIATEPVKSGLGTMIADAKRLYRPLMALEILPLEIFSFTLPEKQTQTEPEE